MLITKPVQGKINEQINYELGACYSYLAMSCCFEQMGLKTLASFFAKQCEEERQHAEKLVSYLQDTGAEVKLAALPAPKANYPSASAIVQAALDNEILITQQINALVALADKQNDYATRAFLNWFVEEQVEEVATMRDLQQLIALAGDDHMLQVESTLRHRMAAAEA